MNKFVSIPTDFMEATLQIFRTYYLFSLKLLNILVQQTT